MAKTSDIKIEKNLCFVSTFLECCSSIEVAHRVWFNSSKIYIFQYFLEFLFSKFCTKVFEVDIQHSSGQQTKNYCCSRSWFISEILLSIAENIQFVSVHYCNNFNLLNSKNFLRDVNVNTDIPHCGVGEVEQGKHMKGNRKYKYTRDNKLSYTLTENRDWVRMGRGGVHSWTIG